MRMSRRAWIGMATTGAIGGTAAVWAATRGGHAASYEIVREYPHDPHAFTQGVIYADGTFYESIGRYGL